MLRRVVTVLLEPLWIVPAVAVFGIGHVGLELARILSRHDIELHLTDTRSEMLSEKRLAVLDDAVADDHVHRISVRPESVIGELPTGSHVLIMTHDHVEDLALCDVALGRRDLGSIGLIGSSGKWARFRRRLASEGGHHAETIAQVRTPIGLPDIEGKEPATIAVSVAADLLRTFEREASLDTSQSLADDLTRAGVDALG
jgi:xanthine dehydrogenase accessory factor